MKKVIISVTAIFALILIGSGSLFNASEPKVLEEAGVSESEEVDAVESNTDNSQSAPATEESGYIVPSEGEVAPYGMFEGKTWTTYQSPSGDVKAVSSGQVIDSGYDNTRYGYYLIVEDNQGNEVEYGYLQADSMSVQVGDEVKQGDVIAAAGYLGMVTDASADPLVAISINGGQIDFEQLI